ncbi:MAG: nucleotidyltransferase domain-containing protein [Cellulosilyticum sp.]|nr:nucleotidyltransferase domain-containing protein [Cellulosilyticum sp.]
MVDLQIRDDLQKRVEETTQYILSAIPQCAVYLFGSYAKRKIKPSSDIDLLVLIDQALSLRDIRDLRIRLGNDYEEQIDFRYEVDFKIYNKERFFEKAKNTSFEQEIQKYMIKVGDNHA